MKEREFQNKLRELFESLRGHTDCFIIRVYWTINKKGDVVLDEDSLKEDFEMRLRELNEILEEEWIYIKQEEI